MGVLAAGAESIITIHGTFFGLFVFRTKGVGVLGSLDCGYAGNTGRQECYEF